MHVLHAISDLPQTPAVYAMYGGKGRGRYVAYIGIAQKLRDRIVQLPGAKNRVADARPTMSAPVVGTKRFSQKTSPA